MRTVRNTGCEKLLQVAKNNTPTHNILRLEKQVAKVGQDNLQPLPSTTICCKVVFKWSEKP